MNLKRNKRTIVYESSRKSLVDILQNYSTYKGYKIVLVFDAHMVEKGSIQKREDGENYCSFLQKKVKQADS